MKKLLFLHFFCLSLIWHKRKNHWNSNFKLNCFYKKDYLLFSNFSIKIQFFVIYFFASVGKFSSPEWVNGTALYYWFSDPVFGLNKTLSSTILPLLKNPFLLILLTWGVLILELLIAFSPMVGSKYYNKIMFIVGFIFHLLIGVFFGLWSFYLAMLGALTYVLLEQYNFKIKNHTYAK